MHCLMEEEEEDQQQQQQQQPSQWDSGASCSLPVDCVAHILSLTSLRDAGVAATVCRTFRAAADSDMAWERFLPPDYNRILSRAVQRVKFSSKRELVARLCRPLLIDAGIRSFCMDKSTGKKCFMVSASRGFGNIWTTIPGRFGECIYYQKSRFSGICAQVNFQVWGIGRILKELPLSPKTTYVAYLIFDPPAGKDLALNQVSQVLRFVCSRPKGDIQIGKRSDGWMEIKIREFYYDTERDDISGKLMDTKIVFNLQYLIVEGVELRPTN